MTEPTTYHCFGAFQDHLHATDTDATACNEDQQSERDELDRTARYVREDQLSAIEAAEEQEFLRQDWRATR